MSCHLFISHRCRSHPRGHLCVSWSCKIRRSLTFHHRLCRLLRAFLSTLHLESFIRLHLQFFSGSWKWFCWDYLHQRAWKSCRFHPWSLWDPFCWSWWWWIRCNWYLTWYPCPFKRRCPWHLVFWRPYRKLSWWPWVIWRRFNLCKWNGLPVFLLSKILKASLSYFMVSSSCYLVLVVLAFLVLLPSLLIIGSPL